MTTGQKAREEKVRHPERYCKEPRCLYRVLKLKEVTPQGEAIREPAPNCVEGRCPKHKHPAKSTIPSLDESIEAFRARTNNNALFPKADDLPETTRHPLDQDHISAMQWFRNGCKFAIALTLLSSSIARADSLPDVPVAKPQPHSHRFYDRIGKIELGAAFTVASADSAITCHTLANGGREMWQPSQTCAGNTAILLGGVAAQEGVAYLLHRIGWHKPERIVRFFTIEQSLKAIRYTQRKGAL